MGVTYFPVPSFSARRRKERIRGAADSQVKEKRVAEKHGKEKTRENI